MEPILLYDTTLRDGTQGENITFTAPEKIKIAERLDDLGIDFIEGGWPGSNPRDMQFFDLARRIRLRHARLAAFGATRKPGIDPADDASIKALIECGTPAVTLFGKSWIMHVERIMNTSRQENLDMIRETVAYMKHKGREVIYDAEHFYDGYLQHSAYALQTLQAAVDGGADYIVLCDTNGGTLPRDIETMTRAAAEALASGGPCPVPLGIHAHNDCALGVANSIAAVEAGASMVQGTINGYGERCGNADLTALLPVLVLKMKRACAAAAHLKKLRSVSRFVSETANLVPRNNRPFVGRSAFAHKGGVHVHAIMKTPAAYEHMDPERVGNSRRVLVSDLSGRSNVEYKARELGVTLGANDWDSRRIVQHIKQLEQEGYQFDVADGSLKILLQKFADQFTPLFELDSFRVTVEKDKDKPCAAHATIKIAVDNRREITAAEGYGPVSALDNALRKALGKFYPDLDTMRLVDFKVRVIDGRDGTAAKVRVLIESRDQDQIWSTIGVSDDIIEASWQALADSFQYKLAKEQRTLPQSAAVARRASAS